jgi:SAM-dependent methyltransferase
LNPRPDATTIAGLYGDQYFTGGREGIDAEGKPVHDYFAFYQELGEEDRYRTEIRELSRLVTPGRILDVGCSTGRFLALARDAGWEASGVELSPLASSFARDKWGLEVVTGQLADAPFTRGSFDAITLHHVLEHIPDPKGFLAMEVLPLLRPGGVLVLEVPNFTSLESRVNRELWQDLRPMEHLYHFSPSTLSHMVVSAGFEVLRVRTKMASWGVKPALEGLGVPARWTRGIRPPAGWWHDVMPSDAVGDRRSLMPAVRKLLLAGLSVPGIVVERLNLAKRLILHGRRPS